MKQLLALLLFVPSLCLAQLPDYVPTDSLVAWYPLDGNGSGSTFASGDAAVMGAQPTTDRFGNPEGAMMFDGNDNLSIPSSPWNIVSPQFSFSIWYNVNTPGSISTYIVEKGSTSGGWEYALSFEPNGEARFIIHEPSGSGGYFMFQGGQIGEGWNHVGFSFDMEGTSFLALNDDIVAEPTVPNGDAPQPGTSTLNLGARRGWASHPDPYGGLNGALDDFAFWNRALTPSEMQAMYDIQTGCMDTSACNYNPLAAFDDGSCISCEVLASACGDGTVWDSVLHVCVAACPPTDSVYVPLPSCGAGTIWDPVNEECIVAIPSDINFDGCVTVADLLVLLSFHGSCPPLPEWPDTDTTWACGDPVTYWNYDYATVQIGNQCWFADNLRTTEFSDSTSIPNVTDAFTWSALSTPARCSYGNVDLYGYLYNWFCVENESHLCPIGWHVPSESDWTQLLAQIDLDGNGSTNAQVLKSSFDWNSDGNGTDEYGFSGFPGGGRSVIGNYANSGNYGFWWSSTEYITNASRAWVFILSIPDIIDLSGNLPQQESGFSVRCIKD